jgi:hypothetical protein
LQEVLKVKPGKMSNSDKESYVTAEEGDRSTTGSYFSLTSGNSVYFTAPTSQDTSLMDEPLLGAEGGLSRSQSTRSRTSEADKDVDKASTSSSPAKHRVVPPSSVAAKSKKVKQQSSQDSTVSTADSSSTTLADFPSDYEDEDDGANAKNPPDDPDKELDAECYKYFKSQHSDELDPIVGNEAHVFRSFTAENLHSRSDSGSPHSSSSNSLEPSGVVQVKADVARICDEIASKPNLDKESQIEEALLIPVEFDKLRRLRQLAISEDGLLTNTIRKRVWPLLLGVSQQDLDRANYNHCHLPRTYNNVSEKVQDQVRLDVSRVLKRFPPGLSDPQQDHLLAYLTRLICSTLDKNPKVYYYQGFHDISLTFLLVCISQKSTPYVAYLCLNKMIQNNLGPFMEITMEAVLNLSHVAYAVLEKEDPRLYKKIVVDSKCPTGFCLPWVLTWFAHTLPNDNDIFRLYDFILGCTTEIYPSCLIPIFTSTSLVLRNSAHILDKTIEEDELAVMHQALSFLPSDQITLEPWLQDSLTLMRKYVTKESQLLKRAKEIKAYQLELWNQESPARRRMRPNGRHGPGANESFVMKVGRFIFIRHKWYTIALIVLGTAYLIQAKYGVINIDSTTYSDIYSKAKALVHNFFVVPAIKWIGNIKKHFEFEAVGLGNRT